MKNILSLDGGGTRGVFTLQVLRQIETLLRKAKGNPNLVLADYFDYIGGTSTGAIIAAALCWGDSVDTIEKFYRYQANRVFSRRMSIGRLRAIYPDPELSQLLRDHFSEEDGTPATLGTKRLRGRFLCVMRNIKTGATWVITNSPDAKYNALDHRYCNLKFPLYQLIRASTAAPVYFPPEEIVNADQSWIFLDGAITPYNNPAFMMYLTTTQAAFGKPWQGTEDAMRLISIGTGRCRAVATKTNIGNIMVWDQLVNIPPAIIDACTQHQDMYCRIVGRCVSGEPIDSEVGAMVFPDPIPGDPRKFVYARYNHELNADEIKEGIAVSPDFFKVDNLPGMEFMTRLGQECAAKVELKHLM